MLEFLCGKNQVKVNKYNFDYYCTKNPHIFWYNWKNRKSSKRRNEPFDGRAIWDSTENVVSSWWNIR